jgi:hypothetical protein
MAKDTENNEDQTKKRRPQGPRPLHVLYKAVGDGDVEIVDATRDANAVIDAIQNDPSLKHKKVETKVGR